MNNQTVKKRNNKIDLLRSIGILLAILAHVGMPSYVQNTRSFDVILLIVLSSMSFIESSSKKKISYKKYVHKRFIRLLLPTFELLVFFLLLIQIGSLCLIGNVTYSFRTIVSSFLLMNESIGYVWIVRIFFIIALLNPILFKIANTRIIIVIPVTLIIYMTGYALTKLLTNTNMFVCDVINDYISYGLMYASITIIGMLFYIRINGSNKRQILFISFFAILFFISQLLISEQCFCVDNYKYPPHIYWVSYGLLVSFVLYSVVPDYEMKMIRWFSDRSFDVYLCHIPYIIIVTKIVIPKITHNTLLVNPIVLFIIVITLSILTAIIVEKIRAQLRAIFSTMLQSKTSKW